MQANIARYGLILNTERFDQCVAFYRDLFGLRQLFEKDEDGFRLVCLEYGARAAAEKLHAAGVPTVVWLRKQPR